MPIYGYQCSSCQHQKDVLQKMSDPVLTECPACGEATFAKQVSAPAFQLKGTGWYVTDFRDGDKGKNGKADGTTEGEKAGAESADKADGAGKASTDSAAESSSSDSSAAASSGSSDSSGGSDSASTKPAASPAPAPTPSSSPASK